MVDKAKIGKKGSGSNIPASPACGQWETLLVDALDGLLQPEDEAKFSSHMATCPDCAELFEQARRGREWLEFLAPEPEVPAYLLDKILVGTGHAKTDKGTFVPGKLVVAGGVAALGAGSNVIPMIPAWQRPGFKAGMRRFAEPRLLMTAAMAFFSIALTLSLTGVRFSAVKLTDLRPALVRSALEKRIMTASTPIVRYYDHLRFVYEVESRVRELRRTTESEQKDPAPQGNKGQPQGESHKKDGGSQVRPSDAPQQTVNPPAQLWGGDAVEAKLETQGGAVSALPLEFADLNRRLSGSEEASKQGKEWTGFSTQVWGSQITGSSETRVLATPDRSTTCNA